MTVNFLRLLNLLKDGQLHSGEDLSKQLGLTRASIWKQIHKIKELGIEVEAITGQGYRLPGGLDLLDGDALTSALAPKVEVVYEPLLTSTNDYLLDYLRSSMHPMPLVVMTEAQTKGRGRHGKSWQSSFAKTILCSLYWPFEKDFHQLAGISLVIAIATVQALEKVGIDSVKIKWPNDLYVGDKKLAGILVETQREAEGLIHTVIGVGLNHYSGSHLKSEQREFIALDTFAQDVPTRQNLSITLVETLLDALQLFSDAGFGAFLAQWKRYDMLAGKRIAVKQHNGICEGVAKGVNPVGHLEILTQTQTVYIDSGYESMVILG